MLKKMGAIGLAIIAGSTLATGTALASGIQGSEEHNAVNEAEAAEAPSATRSVAKVEGVFTFDQSTLSSSEEIRSALTTHAKHLCGSAANYESASQEVSFEDWTLSVGGDVKNAYTVTMGELAEESSDTVTMGCSCIGNLAGGKGAVNAEVGGVTLQTLIARAGLLDSANTIVFTSADGYEIALPLNYVKYRYSLLVYDINGESTHDCIGSANQVWLGATAASYFARDVTSITFETRQTPPPAPGTEEAGDSYANAPGIGVISAGA